MQGAEALFPAHHVIASITSDNTSVCPGCYNGHVGCWQYCGSSCGGGGGIMAQYCIDDVGRQSSKHMVAKCSLSVPAANVMFGGRRHLTEYVSSVIFSLIYIVKYYKGMWYCCRLIWQQAEPARPNSHFREHMECSDWPNNVTWPMDRLQIAKVAVNSTAWSYRSFGRPLLVDMCRGNGSDK